MESQERNFGAEMAAYVAENFMSAIALQKPFQVQGETQSKVLEALTDAVRRDSKGAFEALVRQLRPILIRLAGDLKPEDPQDLISALFVSVKKYGDKTLPEIRLRISRADFGSRRTFARETRKKGALRLVQSQNSGTIKDNKTGEHIPVLLPLEKDLRMVQEVFNDLSEEEQVLWLGYSDETPVAEIAVELQCSEVAVRLRWFRLRPVLEKRLRDFQK
jgi:DNA-directed RNA polymerase specialized sigma24 family protein